LEVQGLDPNEKYIFAVAAYSSDGKLIGDAIGETTRPILAYPPLSATTVRAYLTQVGLECLVISFNLVVITFFSLLTLKFLALTQYFPAKSTNQNFNIMQ